LGIGIVGGCCGTTPEHLKAVVDKVGGLVPKSRTTSLEPAAASLYGVAAYDVVPKPLVIGERTNANGSKKFLDYLVSDDLDGMVTIAKDQVREQAHLLDVCVAYVGRDEVRDMSRLAFRLNTDCTVPVMIDSTEPPAIEAALQRFAGKCLINSINLEDGEGRAREVLALCRRYGAGVVALTINEEGMAKTRATKVEIAHRLYRLAVDEFGLPAGDIFFDMLTFTLGSGEEEYRRAAVETIEAIRAIKAELPGVHTVLGISNISFGLRPVIRQRLNSVFLHHAIEAGLDAAIMHAGKIRPLYQMPEEERRLLEDLVYDRRGEDYDPLMAAIEHFEGHKGDKGIRDAITELPLDERLPRRIVDGNRIGLEDDLDLALKTYSALDIINKLLLNGMKTVGDLFGSGEMQLPFVLQSAETMKAAVKFLEPHLDRGAGPATGKMVIATVKGDVHDIGKNLVDIILSNNGFKIINLGIKQPIDAIIEAFDREKADVIGLSGLLVKSTLVMRDNLEVLQERGLFPPVLLGGAALTRRYVEQDLRSVYPGGKVYYGRDAFEALQLMGEICSGKAPTAEVKQAPRAKAPRRPSPRPQKKISPVTPPVPPFWGSRAVTGIPLTAVTPFINRLALFRGQWGVRKKGRRDEAYERMLRDELEPTLERLIRQTQADQLLQPAVVYGYFPCNSEGDLLHVFASPGDETPLVSLAFPRQDQENGRCIADFFQPLTSGVRDVLAAHLVTVGPRATEEAQRLFDGDYYTEYLYFHGFAVETAEALAEYWHREIRRELGISGQDDPEIKALFRQKYQGSRYSFGYPACPRLEDQAHLFTLLQPERIGVSLTEEWQLVPEQSTSAIIVHHPAAKYFSV
ncbi:MAG: dihydropteroate synthase, partial [Candidatus Marinimicrobia bacterium]|nr:dihydropteroate synthase [Candidatus Neomarinimicrobiota bacterium]